MSMCQRQPITYQTFISVLDRKQEHLTMGETRCSIEKQDLICSFCESLNVFPTLLSYWSHLLSCHVEVEKWKTILEVTRTASIQEKYLELRDLSSQDAE